MTAVRFQGGNPGNLGTQFLEQLESGWYFSSLYNPAMNPLGEYIFQDLVPPATRLSLPMKSVFMMG